MLIQSDIILIQTLTDSYRMQCGWYLELRDLTRQLMGKLVLSRGTLSHLTDSFSKKKALLASISHERDRIAGIVEEWQLRKKTIAECHETRTLNTVLQQIADLIQEFLNDEVQLQKYIEGVVARSTVRQ